MSDGGGSFEWADDDEFEVDDRDGDASPWRGVLRRGGIALAVLLLLGGLGFGAFVLNGVHSDLEDTHTELAASQSEVAGLRSALGEVVVLTGRGDQSLGNRLRRAEDDLEDLRVRIEDLESSLYGIGGPPIGASDDVGQLQLDVQVLSQCVNSITSALRFGSTLFAC